MPGFDILLRLLIAHVVGDFLLQPRKWVDERAGKHHRSTALYLHSLLHGLLALIAMGDITQWPFGLVVAITHLSIDLLKSYKDPRSVKWFAIDQGSHVLVLAGIWAWISGYAPIDDLRSIWYGERTLVVILAFIVLTRPVGILIAVFTSRWSIQLKGKEDNLPNAGLWIGIIERSLILLFVLGGMVEGVGFLLAAKSVFRFGDLNNPHDRMRTEYVLIGTLLSFGIAIGVSLWAQAVMA
jgi:hypothetical protein